MPNGPELPIQMRLGENQVAVRGTEREVDWVTARTFLGNPQAEISKIDIHQAKVRVWDSTSPGFASYWVTTPVLGTLSLPPTLTALSVSYQTGGGSSDYVEVAVTAASGNYSLGVSVGGTAQASAYCTPKLLKNIVDNSRDNFEFRGDWFYLTTTDKTSILAALTAKVGSAVLWLPNFKVEALNFILISEKVSASAHGQYQGSVSHSSSGDSNTGSNGFADGYDTGFTKEDYQFPASLHGSFTLTGTGSYSKTGTVAVSVTGMITGGVGDSATALANGSITPTSVSATSPTDIPHTGLYVYRCDVRPAPEEGNYLIHTLTADFSTV